MSKFIQMNCTVGDTRKWYSRTRRHVLWDAMWYHLYGPTQEKNFY